MGSQLPFLLSQIWPHVGAPGEVTSGTPGLPAPLTPSDSSPQWLPDFLGGPWAAWTGSCSGERTLLSQLFVHHLPGSFHSCLDFLLLGSCWGKGGPGGLGASLSLPLKSHKLTPSMRDPEYFVSLPSPCACFPAPCDV